MAYRRRKTVKHGKIFRTRKGKIGCYKYVNGRKVAFVAKKRSNRSYRKRRY